MYNEVFKFEQSKNFVFFYGGIFSQWYISPFTVEGIRYNCAEQYMMYNKAVLFNDFQIAKRILEVNDPKMQKALGRQVQDFNPKVWDKKAYSIVLEGNIAKFKANRVIRTVMKGTTGDFVECSPYDRIWGVGLGMDHPDRLYPIRWKGKNLLGKALTQTRKELE